MSAGPDFSHYDKAMEDPEYRARLERPGLNPQEEDALYRELDTMVETAENGDTPQERAE